MKVEVNSGVTPIYSFIDMSPEEVSQIDMALQDRLKLLKEWSENTDYPDHVQDCIEITERILGLLGEVKGGGLE